MAPAYAFLIYLGLPVVVRFDHKGNNEPTNKGRHTPCWSGGGISFIWLAADEPAPHIWLEFGRSHLNVVNEPPSCRGRQEAPCDFIGSDERAHLLNRIVCAIAPIGSLGAFGLPECSPTDPNWAALSPLRRRNFSFYELIAHWQTYMVEIGAGLVGDPRCKIGGLPRCALRSPLWPNSHRAPIPFVLLASSPISRNRVRRSQICAKAFRNLPISPTERGTRRARSFYGYLHRPLAYSVRNE